MIRWTPENVAAAARRWYEEHGRAPTASDWKRKLTGYPPHSSAVGRGKQGAFPTWAALREAAGIPTPPRRARSRLRRRKDIAADLRRLADELEGL